MPRPTAGETGASLAWELGLSQSAGNKAAIAFSWKHVAEPPDTKRSINGRPRAARSEP